MKSIEITNQKNLYIKPNYIEIEKLICLKCGNDKKFGASYNCKIRGEVSFDNDEAIVVQKHLVKVDTEFDDDIYCSVCGCYVEDEELELEEKKEEVCNKCHFRFECFTSNYDCRGFEFTKTQAMLKKIINE